MRLTRFTGMWGHSPAMSTWRPFGTRNLRILTINPKLVSPYVAVFRLRGASVSGVYKVLQCESGARSSKLKAFSQGCPKEICT